MKNIDKFIALYDEKSKESFEKWGYYHPPRTLNEFEERNKKTFDKYLNADKYKNDLLLKTQKYPKLVNSLELFGFYIVFKNKDFEHLNNVLFQTSRHNLLNSSMTTSGTDHCNVLLHVARAFAANDFDIINYFLPKTLPQSKGTFYTEISVNLIKVMYYNQTEFVKSAVVKANKFLNKKNTAWEEYVVKYFLALNDRNLKEVNFCLQELCKAYQRIGYPKSPIDKCFGEEIHGLYRFAKAIDESFFKEIERPKHHCFFEEFELWQIDHNYPKGTLFYKYPEELHYMNKFYTVEIPEVTLMEKKYGNKVKIFKDVDLFAIKLTENLN